MRIGKDFGLKNSVFYIRTVLTENNNFLCIFSFTVSIQAFVEGLLRLANVLEATNGTLKNVNNICTLAMNSAKYIYIYKSKLDLNSSSLNRTVCGVIFNVRIGKDFGLKNSVFYIRTVLTENNKFLCIFSFTVWSDSLECWLTGRNVFFVRSLLCPFRRLWKGCLDH
jgi:hypothetical protein